MTAKYSVGILGVHTVSVILSACYFFQFVLDITGIDSHMDAGPLIQNAVDRQNCLLQLSHNTASNSINGAHAINVAVPAICIVVAFTLLRFMVHYYNNGSLGPDYVVAALLNMKGNNSDAGIYHKSLNALLFSSHVVSLVMFSFLLANIRHQTDGTFCRISGFTTETDMSVAIALLVLAIALEVVLTAQNWMCSDCVKFAPYNLSVNFWENSKSNVVRWVILFAACVCTWMAFMYSLSSDLPCSSSNIRDLLYGLLFAVASFATLTTKPQNGLGVMLTCIFAALAFVSLAWHDLVYDKNTLSCTATTDNNNNTLSKADSLWQTVALAFWLLVGAIVVDIGISMMARSEKANDDATGMVVKTGESVDSEALKPKTSAPLQFV